MAKSNYQEHGMLDASQLPRHSMSQIFLFADISIIAILGSIVADKAYDKLKRRSLPAQANVEAEHQSKLAAMRAENDANLERIFREGFAPLTEAINKLHYQMGKFDAKLDMALRLMDGSNGSNTGA
jgi:hypothetical protein